MRNKKNVIIAVLVAVALLMATGYAYFATQLNIDATGSITSNWNVYFSKITEGVAIGSASNASAPSVNGTTANMEANLKVPGDSMTYEITLTNAGTVKAIVEDIKAEAQGSSGIIFTITGIKKGDKIAGGESKIVTVKVEFDSNITSQPTETSKSLTISIDCVQDIGQNIESGDINISENQTMVASILKNNTVQSDSEINFAAISSDTNGKGLYQTTTDNGTVYYFRGDVTNNYVQFGEYQKDDAKYHPGVVEHPTSFSSLEECLANDETISSWGGVCAKEGGTKGEPIYWRIVRINEDGTIKLVYAGTSLDSITGQLIEVDGGNFLYPDINYATSSKKTMIEKWYTNHLEDVYGSYIVDNSFCNDLDIYKTIEGDYADISYVDNYYMGYDRVLNYNPTYNCSSNSSLSVANGKISKPIGILTADEVMYAGGALDQSNTNYYLKYLSNVTMTPSRNDFVLGPTDVVYGIYGGTLVEMYNSSHNAIYLNPVINIRADVEIEGNGTVDSPYVIKMN